jgi:hypothetical protein
LEKALICGLGCGTQTFAKQEDKTQNQHWVALSLNPTKQKMDKVLLVDNPF